MRIERRGQTLILAGATNFKNYRDVSADPQPRNTATLAAVRNGNQSYVIVKDGPRWKATRPPAFEVDSTLGCHRGGEVAERRIGVVLHHGVDVTGLQGGHVVLHYCPGLVAAAHVHSLRMRMLPSQGATETT